MDVIVQQLSMDTFASEDSTYKALSSVSRLLFKVQWQTKCTLASRPSLPCADIMLNTFIVAFAFGFGIAIAIYMIGHHSGGHVNPAVTLGMVGAGMTSPIQAAGNIVSQVLGAILATMVLWVLVPHTLLKGLHLGANTLPEHSTILHAFLGKHRDHILPFSVSFAYRLCSVMKASAPVVDDTCTKS
jgi:hypothetical protein